MYRLFPCIPIFRGFFIKSAKRMCICNYVKNRIGTFLNLCFDVKKWYKQIIALDSCKTYCCDLEKTVMSNVSEHVEISSRTTMTIYFHYCNSYNYQNKQGGELL